MKRAESVTFGGSALDRAAELRGEAEALAQAARECGAAVLMLWRGKPLVTGEARDRLVRLAPDHPMVAPLQRGIFLGRETDGTLIFAQDVSGWEPPDLETAHLGAFVDRSEQVHPDLPHGTVFAELRRIMAHLDTRDAELIATAKAVLEWHRSHRFCARCGIASDVVMSGWQRSCPECGTQHFPRTDPVVIMLITHGNAVLMGRSHGWPEGMYSCLAGFVEPGETIEAAVRREVLEEAGIVVGPVGYLASQPWPFPASLMIGCHGEARTRDIRIDPQEIEDAIWVPREEIMCAMAGDHAAILPARKGAIAHFLLRNWLADTLD